MTIPLLPAFYNMQYTDKDGRLTSDSLSYNDQTFQVVNDIVNVVNAITPTTITGGKVTVQGLLPPAYTNAQVTTLGFADNFPIGMMWYNSTLAKIQYKSAVNLVPPLSTISTITSTP